MGIFAGQVLRLLWKLQKIFDFQSQWNHQLDYNSGHIGNPIYPLFYPYSSEYPAPFPLIWPRINNQKNLDPVCKKGKDLVGKESILGGPLLFMFSNSLPHNYTTMWKIT